MASERRCSDPCRKHPRGRNADALYAGARDGAAPEEITVNLPGVHNVLNSLAAIGVALTLDVPMEAIKEALATFKGVGRRFAVWGEAQSLKEKEPGCR